ncbi:hypothetical protein HYU20_04135 [Candidatus Woesearchaeota archaeon]|nr:hypothetical protein [Candidatus Woesearchaeota archaeon]
MADYVMLAGIAGMAIILILFVLSQLKKLSQDSIAYDAANALGAFLLAYYALALKAWPFLVLNSVWGLFSLYEVIKDVLAKRKR